MTPIVCARSHADLVAELKTLKSLVSTSRKGRIMVQVARPEHVHWLQDLEGGGQNALSYCRVFNNPW